MNVDECIKKGLLLKISQDVPKALESIKTAKKKLELAKNESKHGLYEGAIVSAYTCMFHCARALLFKDGYKERSHFALGVYLKQNYRSKIESRFLNQFDSLRLQRHEVLYGLERNSQEDKQEAIDSVLLANDFYIAVNEIVKSESV